MRPASIIFILFFLLHSPGSIAQWHSDPLINTPVCSAAFGQYNPMIVSDGAGGAIMTWLDNRPGFSSYEIYAQRVNAEGVIQWTTDGVAISTLVNSQPQHPFITADGSGGAIIVWVEPRTVGRGIYAQKINAAGLIQWPVNGVEVYTVSNFIAIQAIISDDAGGAIIGWSDAGSGSFTNDFAQHINSSGTNLWGASGVIVCSASNNQASPAIIKDALGGYIFTWADFRSGSTWDVYAQRLDATGVIQWSVNGIPVAVATNDQQTPEIVSDGMGGAIITWTDDRASSGGVTDIYAQRVNSSGVVQWTLNGSPVCTATDFQSSAQIVSDGTGGAIICWYDSRTGTSDIYAQRINASGAPQWLLDGVVISSAVNNQRLEKIVEDGAGGAVMAWMDFRNGNEDIYTQRVDAAGNVLWTNDGVAVCIAADLQSSPDLVSNGTGGAIIVWQDDRNAGVADIYTQGVNLNGLLPLKLLSFNAIYNQGNDAADLSWQTSNEINTMFFEIQKSEDAIHYKSIGKINATGNTSSVVKYTYTDQHPFEINQDHSYYRLKLVDNDGDFTFSKTAGIQPGHRSSLAIYPNPVKDKLTYTFNAERNEIAVFMISDTKGNIVIRQNIILKKGRNSFSTGISFLPAGAYILSIENNSKYAGTFIKVNE